MTLDVKKKILTMLLILTLMVFAVGFFLIYPLFQEIRQGSQKLFFEKEKLAGFQAEVKNLKEFQGFYEATLQPELEEIEKTFINLEVPIGFIKFLEKIANDSGITIEIRPQNVRKRKDENWSSMNFQVATYGQLSNCFKFLEKLETSPYLIEILSLDAKRLTERDAFSGKTKGLSEGDTMTSMLMKVFGK